MQVNTLVNLGKLLSIIVGMVGERLTRRRGNNMHILCGFLVACFLGYFFWED